MKFLRKNWGVFESNSYCYSNSNYNVSYALCMENRKEEQKKEKLGERIAELENPFILWECSNLLLRKRYEKMQRQAFALQKTLKKCALKINDTLI